MSDNSKRRRTPIVSSAHLVSEQGAELSAFEYGLIVSSHAFERWIVRCAAAAGCGDLSSLDVLVLHSTNHREREKRVGDICFVLNVEDTHTVTYALKKLVRLGLVDRRRQGKESFPRPRRRRGRRPGRPLARPLWSLRPGSTGGDVALNGATWATADGPASIPRQ
jgi:predicted MarR family transcription regulator